MTLGQIKKHMLAALIMVVHYFFGLILYPYQTMRKVAKEKDYAQIGIIFLLIYMYFTLATIVRTRSLYPFFISTSAVVTFAYFLIGFLSTVLFFYIMGRILRMSTSALPLVFTFAYSLFPTMIWFTTTSLLYYLLPPPRTISGYGQLFSIVFIAFSLTLLFWRLILFYLALRFSFKAPFYKIMVAILFFLLWFVPYCFFMYSLRIFRIPFI